MQPTPVLYIARNSIYKSLANTDCWDIARDARTYAGPAPVIAHPPCGHWGKYRHLCLLPGRDCLAHALNQVRKYGGILEHPVGSALALHIAKEDASMDLFGGQTIIVNQYDFGHLALKPTILYYVRCELMPIPRARCGKPRNLESLSRPQRAGTPIDLARWLLESVHSASVQ